jgi:putative ABC transport system ATP-binding protein
MYNNGEIARIEDLTKTYVMGMVTVEALKGVNVSFHAGEYIAVMGPSGCGKSTLLNILGCLDKPSGGRYVLGGEDVSQLDDDRLSEIRSSRLGFVFQSYNLIQQLSVVENIEVPLYYQGVHEDDSRQRARDLAARVGLEARFDHKPYELSGGQQQRVAIARALANDPLIILADEPTGNLDSASGDEIMRLFDELHALGKTVVMVTHSAEVSERAERVIRLRDGEVEHDLKR